MSSFGGRGRKRRGSAKEKKNMGTAMSVLGAIASVSGIALVLWIIIEWFEDNCGFFDDKDLCNIPKSTKELIDYSDYRSIKFLLAWFSLIPFFIAIFVGLGFIGK